MYSKLKHYNPAEPEANLTGVECDEVELACSSAKCKQLFINIQKWGGVKIVHQLLIDMAVCWSSTYVVTSQAEATCPVCDVFHATKDHTNKSCQKIDDLQLSDDEWGNIRLFNDLLAHANNAQQAFSSDQATTLHLALPALEALHKAWSKHAERAKYLKFVPALNAGLAKIEEYYDHTAECDAYTFAMLLDLSQKTEHICKYWGDDKLESILENAEEMSAMCKVDVLICELSDNEDKDGVESSTSPVAANDLCTPWCKDFNGYLNSKDQVGNMTNDEWQGYDVWASLACNMLPIMASSVSSECAFSSAGITITKRCN
ncbi:hypothetical protein F5148DRAFT_1275841 [Russula earlei]|uniref:Uncharacterized protein n=1 Tax=Russula earlei TaxID=71964 RepID=A0ACC0U963_9AGAM|nr:hypothetical protein F5148DRAFT_1275841 [Russula earlei]